MRWFLLQPVFAQISIRLTGRIRGQQVAGQPSRGGIHRRPTAIDVSNHASSVDHESGSFGDAQKIEHAV